MKPVSIVWVAVVGLVAAGLSFLGFLAHMRQGGTPLIVTPGPAVIFAIATACLIWSGLAVRRLRAGKDTWIDAIGAMRVAVFARTSALVGSGLTGILIGVMAVSLTQLEAPAASCGPSSRSPSNAGASSTPTTRDRRPLSAARPPDRPLVVAPRAARRV